jgi:uncharacterized SAM-binding protein YcdF (DUF218 family)
MFFILSKVLLFLFSPFTWFVTLALLAFFWKKDPWKKRFKWAAFSVLLLFTNSFLFLEFCRMWEVPGKKVEQVEKYDVGIVLTGMAEYNNDLNELSIRRGADRIWQALTLYHRKKIHKILITGDNGYVSERGLHEAEQFKKTLVMWGIPEQDIITEERSRNTHENAAETKKLLQRSYPHLKKRLLITSGTHMKRALACFEKEEFPCDPFSTDLYTGPKRNYYWDQYIIPNVSVMSDWERLTKEWFGYLTYDMVGYI